MTTKVVEVVENIIKANFTLKFVDCSFLTHSMTLNFHKKRLINRPTIMKVRGKEQHK